MRVITPRTGIWLFLSLFSIGLLSACAQHSTTTSAEIHRTADYPNLIIWPNSNSHSNNEVVIKLVVRAGSLQETDNQLGYAHLLEHMLFRGTERFPGDQLQTRLRELGLVMGTHSNAYTSFDETTYWFYLNTATPQRVNAVLEIVAEMAFHAQIDDAALAIEKSVVLQEWRDYTRDQNRVGEVLFNDLFAGSRYAQRRPIGTSESIQQATAQGLRDFYREWYQAPNMTLVVSGDIDAEDIQTQFLAHFKQPFRAPMGQPQQYPLALDRISERLIVTDPYTTSGSAWLGFIHPIAPVRTTDGWLDDIKRIAAYDILLDRLERRLVETQGRVSDFEYYYDHFLPGFYLMEIGATATTTGLPLAVQIIEQERQRLLIGGISELELERWKRSFLRHERLQQDSAWHLSEEARLHVMLGRPLLNQSEKLALLESAVPEWTTQEVLRAVLPTLSLAPNVQIIHPYNVPAPSEADVDAWLASGTYLADAGALDAAEIEDVGFDETWPIAPTYSGALTSERVLDNGVVEWKLDNGIEVLFYQQQSTPGKAYFTLVGLGGFNRMSPEETLTGRIVTDVMGYSGLRQLDGAELSQWLQSQGLGLLATQDFYDRLMHGYAPSEDFDRVLRVLHSALTEAKADPLVWEHMLTQYRDYLIQWSDNPQHLWSDTLAEVLFNQDPALRSLTLEELDTITLEGMVDNYRRFIAGAQNYRLVIVGDIAQQEAYAAVMESVATLPPTDQVVAVNRQYPQILASSAVHVPGSGEQSAQVVLRYAVPKDSLPPSFNLDRLYLERWMDEILFDEIRNNQGMVYAIQTEFEGRTIYEDELRLVISLAVHPDRVADSVQAIEALMQRPPHKVTQAQVDHWHRDFMNQQRARAHQSAESMAFDLAYAELFQLDVNHLVTGEVRRAAPEAVLALLGRFSAPNATRQELVWLP
ncbi:insulinase family protein [Salinispirillum sp. LH 10-3-1]|uniref:Insulinase family protein n=1 Tax=Salinispirillum sp. LH 10-3-1 TaxID=2952525 RepID=A0AB38YGG1_9GAMM